MKRGMEASAPRGPAAPFPLARALFFASGLTALVYQMMWMRGFGLVFGSTTRAASAVLASFFLGMAVGNWLGGRLARDRPRALARYGVAEIAIGVGALLVLVLLDLYHDHYPVLYQWSGGDGRGLAAIQLLLAFAAMGPPCIAMGATLPLIAQAVSDETRDVGRRTSAIYGVNTLGAAELFAEHNHGVLHHGRVETVVADGRNHLAGTSERFDVVVGDLFVPWHAGTGYLYTVEHFRNVARRLTERGVFVQWIPGDQLSLAEVQVLIMSMRVAFPNMSVCRVRKSRLYGLVGHGPAASPAVLRTPSPDFTCASDYAEGWQRGVPPNTDDHPIIEFSAARSHLEKSPRSLAQVDRFFAELLGDPPDGG